MGRVEEVVEEVEEVEEEVVVQQQIKRAGITSDCRAKETEPRICQRAEQQFSHVSLIKLVDMWKELEERKRRRRRRRRR